MVEENKMKIDITGSNLQAFLGLAQKFPNGTIIAEDGVAYWEWDGQVQQIQQPMMMQPQGGQPMQQKKNAFLNMFDSMAQYF